MDNGGSWTPSSNFGFGGIYSSSSNNGLNNRGLYRSTSLERALNIRSNTTSIHGYSNNCYPLTKVGSLTDRTNRPTSTNKSSYESGTVSKSNSRTDVVDYKHLYEMEKRKQQELLETVSRLKKLAGQQKNDDSHRTLSLQQQCMNGHSGSLSEKITELQEKNKEFEEVQQEHKKLKQENLALIRVMAKLSKSG